MFFVIQPIFYWVLFILYTLSHREEIPIGVDGPVMTASGEEDYWPIIKRKI
jgi:hypothetical protein